MRAAVYYENGGPEVLRYEEVPDPELRPGGVLVEVEAIGIQGGDLHNREGGALATVPHIVGYQAAGVVRAVGSEVTTITPGERVVATMGAGSHAELVAVSARGAWVLPEGLSSEQAACVPAEFGTADDCLFEFGRLRAGETVLVHAAASGVGIAAVQLAKAAGAVVLGTASSDDRLARLGGFGLDHGINYATTEFVAEVRRLTDGRGVDLVVDSVGGHVLESSIAALAYRGRISWVGHAGREAVVPDVWPLIMKNATLTGILFGAELARDPGRTRPLVAGLLARVASGELQVVVDRRYPLAEAAEAHRYIQDRRAFGRVVLVP